MAERPTQAPQIEKIAPNPGHIKQRDFTKHALNEKVVHPLPDGVDEALAEELSDQDRSNFIENPLPAAPEKKSGFPLWAKITAGVGALATAGTVGLLAARGGDEVPAAGTHPVATGEAFPGETIKNNPEQKLDPAATDPEIFKNQSYEMILSETVPFLEGRREESLRKIDEYFASIGEDSIPKTENLINPTPELIHAQDIERQIAADTYTITEVAITQPDFAENLSRAVFRNSTSYEVFTENDLDGLKHATKVQVYAVSPELPQGMQFGTQTLEGPSLVLLSSNLSRPHKADGSPELMNRVVTEYTYDGDKKHFALTYQITEDNSHFVEYPENLVPPTK